jgi:LysR family glycine cleavage system transcriptional activator
MAVKAPRPRLPSLNALRAFEAAARLQSFAKAADELAVTPGAVAQQIRQLEDWVRAPLFHRFPHGVTLTEAAGDVLPHLSAGFDAIAASAHRLRGRSGSREISIAALPCIAQIWLTSRLPGLRKAFPGLQVSISALEEPPNFRRDLYDFGIFYLETAPPGIEAISLDEDALFPVATPELAATLNAPADLADAILLHDAVWRNDWKQWFAFAGLPGIDPRGPSFSLYALALEAALAGDGVLMGRRSLIAPHLASGRLVAPFDIKMPTRTRLTILSPPARSPNELRHGVVDWLRATS